MIRVLLFSELFSDKRGGGIKRYCNNLVKLFANHPDIQVTYSTLKVKGNRVLGSKLNLEQLKEELNKYKPNIVHLNGYTSRMVRQVVSLSRDMQFKVVYTPHWHPFKTMKLGLLKELYFNLFIRPCIKKMSGIVAINNDDFRFLSHYSNQVVQIPHWLPNVTLRQSSVSKDLQHQEGNILFVGRTTDKNKGLDYLVKLPQTNLKFHIVGQHCGIERPDFKFYSDISDDELGWLYDTSSLLVVPSRYEAFSYASLEALCHNTPILVSNSVKITDYLPNGVYTKCNPENTDELLTVINKAQKIRIEDSSFLEVFDPIKARKKYEEFYKNSLMD